MKSRPLAPKGGNDRVFTPPPLALAIVGHFKPYGRKLEPCRGAGAFSDAMPGCDWCELAEGRDFLRWEDRRAAAGWSPSATLSGQPGWDWIVTNPPWSQFRPFLQTAMGCADHVVFLALLNAWFMRARVEDVRAARFGLVEALLIPTPPKPWPQTGFQLAAVHARRGYTGPLAFSHLG